MNKTQKNDKPNFNPVEKGIEICDESQIFGGDEYVDLGCAVGFLVIVGILTVCALKGYFSLLYDLKTFLLLCLTTFAYLIVSCQVLGLYYICKNIKYLYKIKLFSPLDTVSTLVSLSERCRREGVSIVKKIIIEFGCGFLFNAVYLLLREVDGKDIKTILDTEIREMCERHNRIQSLILHAGKAVMTLGVLITVFRLLILLGSGVDYAKFYASLSQILLSTFYGAVLNFCIFQPTASRMGGMMTYNMLDMKLIREGVISIRNGEEPQLLELRLLAFFPPEIRPLRELDIDNEDKKERMKKAP